MTWTLNMNLGKILSNIGMIMFVIGFATSIMGVTGLFGEFSEGRIIELSAIGFTGFVLIGIGRKMKRKDELNEKLDSDVKKNTDEEDSKP